MAHSKSAEKRIRQNAQRRLRNRRRKAQVKESVRAFDDAVATGDAKTAAEQFKEVTRRLDKVAARGTIHKATAARKKSRLAKQLNRLSTK